LGVSVPFQDVYNGITLGFKFMEHPEKLSSNDGFSRCIEVINHDYSGWDEKYTQ
jgi:hypothetical protein